MAYVLPTIPSFKVQFERDFPFATPLTKPGVVGARATASIVGQAISSVTVTAPGSGYGARVPSIVYYAGGGYGAILQVVLTGGAVSAVNVLDGGYGFLKAPVIYIAVGGDNTDLDKVTDTDIARAFNTALMFNMTERLFGSQEAYTQAYNLLAAHYLCINILNSGSGLNGTAAAWATQAKTVGNVHEAYGIPDRVMRSPVLSRFSQTTYGALFLELISPQLIGNVKSFRGVTHP